MSMDTFTSSPLSPAQSFVRLDHIRKCFTQKGVFVLEEFSKSQFGIWEGEKTEAESARQWQSVRKKIAMRCNFLFALHCIAKKFACVTSRTELALCLPTDPKTRHVTQRRYSSSMVSKSAGGAGRGGRAKLPTSLHFGQQVLFNGNCIGKKWQQVLFNCLENKVENPHNGPSAFMV